MTNTLTKQKQKSIKYLLAAAVSLLVINIAIESLKKPKKESAVHELSVKEKTDKELLRKIVNEFIGYSRVHFSTEENYFKGKKIDLKSCIPILNFVLSEDGSPDSRQCEFLLEKTREEK